MSSRSKRSPLSVPGVVPIEEARNARLRLAKAIAPQGDPETLEPPVETSAENVAAEAAPRELAPPAVVKTAKGRAKPKAKEKVGLAAPGDDEKLEIRVRRIHRRDINRTWEFLKLVFRDVNRQTVEYQRPRSKPRFAEVYEDDGGEQLLFEVDNKIVGYAECSFDPTGSDNWVNPRYFDKRGMRPLYVDELAVHPDYQGRGVGAFMLDQLQHLARVRGCTHLVLEVAENNKGALTWYRKRNFYRLDAAIFLAQRVPAEPELLPPRRLPPRKERPASSAPVPKTSRSRKKK